MIGAHALALFDAGYPVLPLYERGKRPLINAWSKIHITRELVLQWWAQWPNANVGIRMGGPLRLVALDVDGPEGRESLARLESTHGPLPETLRQKTGRIDGGEQRIFQCPEHLPITAFGNSASAVAEHLDIRAEGGQIVAPPSIHQSGGTYTWLTNVAPAPMPDWLYHEAIRASSKHSTASTKTTTSAQPSDGSIASGRNQHLLSCASSWHLSGLSEAEVRTNVLAANAAFQYPLDEHEINTTIFVTLQKWEEQRAEERQWVDTFSALLVAAGALHEPPPEAPTIFPLTEVGNAKRLERRHADKIRHVTAWDAWVAWDGQRWTQENADVLVYQLSKETVRSIASERAAEGIVTSADDDPFKKWSRRSDNLRPIQCMTILAKSEPKIAIATERFDTDPMLFNVANGTIDLRTGHLRQHTREDFLTKLSPVAYDPTATCPTWERFVSEIMCDDIELVNYLQRAVGYSLTADVKEQCLFFLVGNGANGKSTFINVIMSLLGEYAKTGAPNLLLMKQGEPHPTETSGLFGTRFVSCQEVEEGRAWAESMVKQLTGVDPISTRKMHQDFWDFLPTHKLWVSGNHRPNVRGTDNGIWRRLRLIPFNASFLGREDREIAERLQSELPGILRWAISGCLSWQMCGLPLPEAVQSATQSYREEQDLVGSFLQEYCIFEEGAVARRGDLRKAYEKYCNDIGTKPYGAKTFASALTSRGAVPHGHIRTATPPWVFGDMPIFNPSSQDRSWLGLRFKTEAESNID